MHERDCHMDHVVPASVKGLDCNQINLLRKQYGDAGSRTRARPTPLERLGLHSLIDGPEAMVWENNGLNINEVVFTAW